MIQKINSRQRAISDYEFARKKNISKFTAHIHEARLLVNVARLSTMYAYIKILFGNEVWKSEASKIGGLHPKWDQVGSFSFSLEKPLTLIAFDKSFIFGETEIGRGTIYLSDVLQGHSTEWWDLMTPSNEIAGAILITFDFLSQETTPTHTLNNSWDLKMHHHVESSPIVSRIRSKGLSHYSTPDIKAMHCNTEPDEVITLEQIRSELIEKSENIRGQESKAKICFDRLKEESSSVKNERLELRRSQDLLHSKEEAILNDKRRMEEEREEMERDKEEIEKLRETLKREFMDLKQEKLRMKAQKRLQQWTDLKIQQRKDEVAKLKEFFSNAHKGK